MAVHLAIADDVFDDVFDGAFLCCPFSHDEICELSQFLRVFLPTLIIVCIVYLSVGIIGIHLSQFLFFKKVPL